MQGKLWLVEGRDTPPTFPWFLMATLWIEAPPPPPPPRHKSLCLQLLSFVSLIWQESCSILLSFMPSSFSYFDQQKKKGFGEKKKKERKEITSIHFIITNRFALATKSIIFSQAPAPPSPPPTPQVDQEFSHLWPILLA